MENRPKNVKKEPTKTHECSYVQIKEIKYNKVFTKTLV